MNDFNSLETRRNPDGKSSDGYLALAKALVAAVHDEADIDSIRALAILVSDFISIKCYEYRL
jgi:aldehyde dehydrogenase (NAD+)